MELEALQQRGSSQADLERGQIWEQVASPTSQMSWDRERYYLTVGL